MTINLCIFHPQNIWDIEITSCWDWWGAHVPHPPLNLEMRRQKWHGKQDFTGRNMGMRASASRKEVIGVICHHLFASWTGPCSLKIWCDYCESLVKTIARRCVLLECCSVGLWKACFLKLWAHLSMCYWTLEGGAGHLCGSTGAINTHSSLCRFCS